MAGIDHNLYSMLITALIGKVDGKDSTGKLATSYAARINYNHNPLPYYENRPVGRQGSATYSSYKLINASPLDTIEAPILSLNKESYLGLIANKPVWHHGPAQYNGITTANPEINTSTVSGYSFLEVQEIPNSNRNYFALAGSQAPDTSKFFGGLYWPSYQRIQLYKRLPNMTCNLDVQAASEEGGVGRARYSAVPDEYASDLLTYQNTKATVTKDGINDLEFQIYLTNQNAIYMGENLETINWPSVRYFGLFNTRHTPTGIISDNNTLNPKKYMEDNNLYYWGEFEENDSWYHRWTYDASEWSSIYPLLSYKVNGVWTANTSSTYDSSKIYYNKYEVWNYMEQEWDSMYNELYYINTSGGTKTLVKNTSNTYVPGTIYYKISGIIVAPHQGGVFSKNKFQLRWNSEIISNQFSV